MKNILPNQRGRPENINKIPAGHRLTGIMTVDFLSLHFFVFPLVDYQALEGGDFRSYITGLEQANIMDAVLAYVFTFVMGHIFGVAAEDAGRLIFFQDYLVAVNIYFKRVPYLNIKGPPQLDRKDDTAKFINLANDTCGFHKYNSFSICILYRRFFLASIPS